MKKVYDFNGKMVYFKITEYSENPMVMALMSFTEDDEPYYTISVNLGNFAGELSFIRQNCAFIDTNNVPDVEAFLEGVGATPYTRFGEPVIAESLFCTYPLYEFPEELLIEMDADGYSEHVAVYKNELVKAQRELNIAMFGFSPF